MAQTFFFLSLRRPYYFSALVYMYGAASLPNSALGRAGLFSAVLSVGRAFLFPLPPFRVLLSFLAPQALVFSEFPVRQRIRDTLPFGRVAVPF